MPGIFGQVVRDLDLSTFNASAIVELSTLLREQGVTPVYAGHWLASTGRGGARASPQKHTARAKP